MKEDKLILPLIPLRGLTVFPNMVIYFDAYILKHAGKRS